MTNELGAPRHSAQGSPTRTLNEVTRDVQYSEATV